MRQSLILTFIFLSCCLTVIGQKTAKYTYKFQLDTLARPASIEVNSLPYERFTASGQVFYQTRAIPFVTIQISSKDTTMWKMADSTGAFQFSLQQGAYMLTATAAGYEPVEYAFNITDVNGLNFKVNLARQPSHTWYVIQSSKPLKKAEIEAIRRCISLNKDKPYDCYKKKPYRVIIEI